MTALPSGTVTFLFTDIEGSTRLVQQHVAAWPNAKARHDAILQNAIASYGGHVFQVIGDALCAAFHTAPDALAAALEAQRALHAEPWGDTVIRVRIGLHTGSAIARTDGDYEGYLTLVRAQRIVAAACGGQVLLSQSTADLVEDALRDGVGLRDLGTHRLKDLGAPEHLHQLTAPGLPVDFPPLKTADQPNNLPTQLTSFIGRESEVAEARRLLGNTRLLTLSGAGGVGKTRLALQVAAEELVTFHDGVWLVELAPLADPALIPSTIASAVGVREEPSRPMLAALGDHFRAKSAIIVLDNCEHLIADAAKVCDTLLHAAPHLKIIATSREALGIAGETAYRVPSLGVPANDAGFGTLTRVASVQLFGERARAAKTDFVLTSANAPAVAQICRRLDGIPLAIELAAARVKLFPAEQIASRLDDRFRLLTGGSRTALPRQQTLRALVDWSYTLLSEPERVLLRRLAVFAGGWTLDAAEAVCADAAEADGRPPLPVVDVLELLSHLVEKSLVVAEERTGSARYRMLETIRQYAREKLLDVQAGTALRDRHLRYFVKLAAEIEPMLYGKELVEGLNQLEADVDNVRVALDWAKETGQTDTGLALASALYMFWYLRGHQAEGLQWLQDLLAKPLSGPATATRAQAWAVAGLLHLRFGSYPEATRAAQEALEISQRIDNQRTIALAYFVLGFAAAFQGDHETAQALYGKALVIFRALKNHSWSGTVTGYIGESALSQGEYKRAQQWIAEAAALQQELGEKDGLTHSVRMWGYALLYQGDEQAARAKFHESLTGNHEIGDRQGIGACLTACAAAAMVRTDFRRAAMLLGATQAVCESIHAQLLPYDHEQYTRNVATVRAQLPEAVFNAAWADGRALTMEQAIAYALEGGDA